MKYIPRSRLSPNIKVWLLFYLLARFFCKITFLQLWFMLVAAVRAWVAAAASQEPNMNGRYYISATPGAKNISQFPTNYRDYPGGVEYFDLYSPVIKTLYSQVFWTQLPPVALPAQIIDRFDGKAMAVVGFEINQVRKIVLLPLYSPFFLMK